MHLTDVRRSLPASGKLLIRQLIACVIIYNVLSPQLAVAEYFIVV